MTTELLEFDRESATDTDLSAPEPDKAERARADVVRVWSTERRNPTSRFFNRLHLTGAETYEIDRESWRHFDRALDTHVALAHLRMSFSSDVETRHTHPATLFTPPVEETKNADRRRRYARLLKRLDEWAADMTGFDERVAPLIEEALRETAPRHFPDE